MKMVRCKMACIQFQVTPKLSHLNAVKKDFRKTDTWQAKKQTIVANSTTEAEYVAAANCCGQVQVLRATYCAELVSAASLVNTARPTLSTARLGKFDAVRQIWAAEAICAAVEKFKENPLNLNPHPLLLNLVQETTPPETSSSHATTQDSRDSLEETNGNEGDQVQTSHDSPLSGGHTSDRAEGALNLQELSVLCTNLSNKVLTLESIKDAQAVEIQMSRSQVWNNHGKLRKLLMRGGKVLKLKRVSVDLMLQKLRKTWTVVIKEEMLKNYGVPHDYYRVFRSNESSRYIKTFIEMVLRFDRLDFIELHSLVMQRFSTTTLEGIDLVLWGDLRIMFEETTDDDI
ncbi:hypothetical protein Tco_0951145 [Tanacetum coccineum]|uniref:Uncharacterized protein n=1 Tax=Tanacetum coccineum TaxID=301880 RepID=A0ABQ5DTR0_9ASTR